MKHKKKGTSGRFLSILLAAVMALSWLPADILSPAVHAEETGYDEAAGGAETEKSVSLEEDGNAVPAEESGAEEDDTEEPETGAGSREEPESGAGSTEEPEDGEEPGEEPVSTEKEDTAECVCGTLCTADSANADCPVCGVEGAGIAGCKGEPEDAKKPETEKEDTEQKDTEEENTKQEDTEQKDAEEENTKQEDTEQEDTEEENTKQEDTEQKDTEEENTKQEDTEQENTEEENTEREDTEQEDTEEENTKQEVIEQEDTQDAGLCGHHPEHTADCGYTEGTQDGEGTPCTYECRICPIEDLIAALPEEVTEDHAEDVRAQLDEILSLYRELTEEEQDQLDLSRCYELQEALDAAGVPELLAGDVSADYRKAEWNGSEVVYSDETETACTAVTDSGVTWDAGWYVVNSIVTVSEPITVNGEVHLILADNGALDAQKGVVVSTDNSLTIYGQAGGTGKLTATGAAGCAGIGSVNQDGRVRNSGAITIYGGMVEAIGGENGAGIGGGGSSTIGGAGQNITIYGGEVTATGGSNGAGIGGGNLGAGSSITIYGGTVEATGGSNGAGIGGGSEQAGIGVGGTGSEITINGGTVTATGGSRGGAGIGGGKGGKGRGITISGGTVEATGGSNGAGIGGGDGKAGSKITISGGEVTATGGEFGAGIGGGATGGEGSDIEISGGTVTATGGEFGAGIGGGYLYGAGRGITISGGTVEATGVKSGAGIGGAGGGAGSKITISGGEVTATGGSSGGAGIGGGAGSGGTGSDIAISGGTVEATGGSRGAGIGGGSNGAGSDIAISGGTVEATGGFMGAGIGGGYGKAGSKITISGGEVTATGGGGLFGGYGAGIGGGQDGASNGFSTGDDGSAVIFASSIGDTSGQDDWKGVIFRGDDGTVYGDVTLTEGFEIPGGKTLTIPDGSSLTIPEGVSVTNGGALTIDGGELTGGGALAGSGTFRKESLTADMILVPTGLYYTPDRTTEELKEMVSISSSEKILGQTFTVDIGAWTLSVTKESELKYTATYTSDDDPNKKISKTITLRQSGTAFVGNGAVKTYKDGTETDAFAYSDTITVKATPTATGEAPAANGPAFAAAGVAPLMAASLDEPAAGQMAVYYKGVQVSAPSTVADGVHTMTVDTADLGLTGQEFNKEIPLTVRYIASPTMADAESTVKVTVTAAAKVETNAGGVAYVGNLQDAFGTANNGATITLLRGVTLTERINVTTNITLDLNGYTITGGDTAFSVGFGCLSISNSGTAGGIQASGNAIEVTGGTLMLDGGGAFASTGGGCGISVTNGGLTVKGENAEIEKLSVSGSVSVNLYSGTYKGAPAIRISGGGHALGDFLYDGDGTYRAFFADGKPVDLTALQSQTELDGSVTVKPCTHEEDVSVCQSNGNGTHALTCRACGYSRTAENCVYGRLAGTVEDRTVHLTEECVACGYSKPLGDIAVTIPKLTYGKTAGKKDEFKWRSDIEFGDFKPEFDVDGAGGNLFEQKLAGLSAGEYKDRLTLKVVYPINATIDDTGTTTHAFPIPFTIDQAVLTEDMATLSPESATYTGAEQKPAITVMQGTNTLTAGKDYEISYSRGGTATTDFTGVGTVTVTVAGKGNYTGTITKEYTISYMAAPALLYNGSSEMRSYYNGDVVVTAVSSGSNAYTVSDAINGAYGGSYTIRAQAGAVEKTLYFKDGNGHISAGVPVTVNFDLTPPTGGVSVGAKWWHNALRFVSFGHYKAQEYTVAIKAEDKGGSGPGSIDYAIVTGDTQYADVNALEKAVQDGTVSWTEYDSDSNPAVPVNSSPYAVYARLTDNAGNVTYISTDGILLDNTPPTVDELAVPEETRRDVTAGLTFTVSEAADYYFAVLPQGSPAPSAEDIIVTCGGTLPAGSDKTGTSIAGTVGSGSGAVSADTFPAGVSVDVKALSPNTAYTLYITAVDRTLDITSSQDGTPAGNIGDVARTDFTTKKPLPVITKAPAVTGTYGQRVGEMTVTGGTAQGAGGAALTGTWAVSGTDSGKEPAVGTKEEVTVIFTPDSDSYDSESVKVIPTVSPRSLRAPGVAISEVAGDYTYTGSEIRPTVAVNTGTPAKGICIFDSGASLTGSDYTVSYSNNRNAGTATVTITGTGNYTGTVTRTFTIGKAAGRPIANLSGSYTDNGSVYTYAIDPVAGAVYSMDGVSWTEGNCFEGIRPGTEVTFYAKIPEDENHKDGVPASLKVSFPKLSQTAPVLSYTRATDTLTGEITLAITAAEGAEYSFDGGNTWTDNREQGGFHRSQTVTLAVRRKETDIHNPSPANTMTVNLAKEDRGAPPDFTLTYEANGETDYTVTIPPTEGCEYSFDGVTWSDNNVRSGVKTGEKVTGYKRYKETDAYNAGVPVSADETMPKFTVKTPMISPAGGAREGSISVTITCGTQGAQIYYTTDGSTPTRSSIRYTGAFTLTAPAEVKAIAVKDGFPDSTIASETYTKKDSGSGSSGGSGSGGNGNHGNGGQESGGDNGQEPGDGNTTPEMPVIPPADNTTDPGQGPGPVKPGTGDTGKPGDGAVSPAMGTKQPFIKGADGKAGWDMIRTEEEKAKEGSVINVDMNGTTVVPEDIFDSIKGRDITITFDMGNGIIWSVDGKSVAAEKTGDIDFSVKTGVSVVPADIINHVTGERYSIQISLSYEGEFGFTAVLIIDLGKENAGYTASLYYYNESTGELELICKDEVAEDGTVSLAFTNASDYVIAIDGDEEEESGTGPAQPESAKAPDKTAGNDAAADESPGTGQGKKTVWPIVAGILALAGAGIAAALAWRKKEKEEDIK